MLEGGRKGGPDPLTPSSWLCLRRDGALGRVCKGGRHAQRSFTLWGGGRGWNIMFSDLACCGKGVVGEKLV